MTKLTVLAAALLATTGATAASLALTNVQAANSGVYRCVATNVHGAVNSQPAILTVMVPPTITTHPANASAPGGQPLLLAVTATGPGALTFQWQKDGVNIPNADAFTIAKGDARRQQ